MSSATLLNIATYLIGSDRSDTVPIADCGENMGGELVRTWMPSRAWKKRALWAALAGVIALALWGYSQLNGSKAARYITAPVDRGTIVHSVTATGTVNPVTVVQVGTYVSGPITSIYADFNTPVKAGQLLAKIDPRPFAAQVALSRSLYHALS